MIRMDKNRLIIYQINPRMFTLPGTLSAAAKLLPHLSSVGVNTVYLFSICKEDDSEDRDFWSVRQKASGLNNPKNPYRIADYYAIDEEYGGNEELRIFVEEAHRLDMAVMMDIVYFHCAPNSKLISEIPDGVIRDEQGEIELGQWNFPRLNYKSRALRDYLIDNMCYWVREYDIDGFRCDVADLVPLDFWTEAVGVVRGLKPNLIMLNEGQDPAYVRSGVFDMNYHGFWLGQSCNDFCAAIGSYGIRRDNGIWFVENHDTVTDWGRADTLYGAEAADCMYVYNFTAYGTPMLYCGEEIGDSNPHTLFANRDHNRGHGVDWSNALLPHGKRRMELVTALAALRTGEDALALGEMAWLETEAGVLGFTRRFGAETISVLINFSEDSKAVRTEGRVLLSRGLSAHELKPYGFVISKQEGGSDGMENLG
jgi:glycosidase